MKDKEKQIDFEKGWELYQAEKKTNIEEMAKSYCQNPYSCYGHNCLVNSPCIVFELCKHLYNAGYRRIDKDSVVISRATWFETQNYKYNLGFNTGKQISRKETAEKILKTVLEDVGEFYAGDIVEELAKQFGLEIKE